MLVGVSAASSGPNSGGTFASVSFSGADDPWFNPSNAATSNDSYATATIGSSSDVTYYLRATNFNFAIPVGATINGIQVQVERHQTCVDSTPLCTSYVHDNRVRLVKSGSIGTTDRADATSWTTSDTTATYGSSTDLWGTSWTVSDINSATTGIVLSARRTMGGDQSARVDQITMTIYYTLCGNGVVETGEECDDGNTNNGDCCSSTCQYEQVGSSCDDGQYCNVGETCNGAGACTGGSARDCSASGDQCNNGICNEQSDQCEATPKQDGTQCNDGLYCTNPDTCTSGVCGGPSRDCSDNIACTDDSCNEDNDVCVNTANNANCDDGNVCTDDSCDPLSGCVYTNNNNQCDDNNACTEQDTCAAGQCSGTPITCNDGNVCTDDSCDPLSGCVYSNYPLSTPCEADGDFCTVDHCDGYGACVYEQPYDCDDGVSCTVDSCNEAQDKCDNVPTDALCPPDTVCADNYCSATLDCQVNYQPPTTECRAPSGPCDIPEFCTGSSTECPPPVDSSFMTVNSPKEGDYNNRRISFNISLFGKVDKLRYIDLNETRPRNKTLCINCNEYGFTRKKIKSLSEGDHSLVFYAIKDDEVICQEEVDLFVDSKKPRITKTEPRRFANGNFSVEFIEENPDSVVLNYGASDTRKKELDITNDCSLEKGRYSCSVFVEDLKDFETQKIRYWFNVTDVVGAYDTNKPIEVTVDTIPAYITRADWSVKGSYLYLNISLSDEARYLKYIDYEDSKPREKPLCYRCDEYGSSRGRKKLFSRGDHNIDIISEDEAGNRDTKDNIIFTIS